MMHSNISENDWSKVKGEIQKTWSSLNASELEKTHGDVTEICSLVQEKYGLNKADAERRLDEVIQRCGTAAGQASVSKASSSDSSQQRDSQQGSSMPRNSTQSDARFEAGAEKPRDTRETQRGPQSPDVPSQPSKSEQEPGRTERSNENVKTGTPNQSQRGDNSRRS